MIWEDSVYVVIDIGCLECGLPSRVIAIEDTLEWAKKAVLSDEEWTSVVWLDMPPHDMDWGGQARAAIFKLPSGELVGLGK